MTFTEQQLEDYQVKVSCLWFGLCSGIQKVLISKFVFEFVKFVFTILSSWYDCLFVLEIYFQI